MALAIGTFSSSAFAEKVNLQFSDVLVGVLNTDSAFERVYVTIQADGKIQLSIGRIPPVILEATVESDQRPSDGPLTLNLGGDRKLIVGSGFTPDGVQSFTLVMGDNSVQLKPLVFLNVSP